MRSATGATISAGARPAQTRPSPARMMVSPIPARIPAMAEAHLECGVGDCADAELSDQAVCGARPCLVAGDALDRVLAVEAGPVLAVHVELVGAGLEHLAVVSS